MGNVSPPAAAAAASAPAVNSASQDKLGDTRRQGCGKRGRTEPIAHQPACKKQRPASACAVTAAADTCAGNSSRLAPGTQTPQNATNPDARQAHADPVSRAAQPSQSPCTHKAPAAAAKKVASANPKTAKGPGFSIAHKAAGLSTAVKGFKLRTPGKSVVISSSKPSNSSAKTANFKQAAKPSRPAARTMLAPARKLCQAVSRASTPPSGVQPAVAAAAKLRGAALPKRAAGIVKQACKSTSMTCKPKIKAAWR